MIDLLDLFLLILFEFVISLVEILLRAFFTQFIIRRYEFVLNVEVSLILRIDIVLDGDDVVLGVFEHTEGSTEILLEEFGQVGVISINWPCTINWFAELIFTTNRFRLLISLSSIF